MTNYCKKIPFWCLVRLEFSMRKAHLYLVVSAMSVWISWNLFFHSEDGGSKLYQNVCTHLLNYTEVKIKKASIHAMTAYRRRTCLIHSFLTSELDRDVIFTESHPTRQQSFFWNLFTLSIMTVMKVKYPRQGELKIIIYKTHFWMFSFLNWLHHAA